MKKIVRKYRGAQRLAQIRQNRDEDGEINTKDLRDAGFWRLADQLDAAWLARNAAENAAYQEKHRLIRGWSTPKPQRPRRVPRGFSIFRRTREMNESYPWRFERRNGRTVMVLQRSWKHMQNVLPADPLNMSPEENERVKAIIAEENARQNRKKRW